MYLQPCDELRRIRITLIIMTIILLFTSGRTTNMTVDHTNDQMNDVSTYNKNLVPLGNGYFGLFSGDTTAKEDNKMKVYFYNEKENKMVQKNDIDLETVEIEE